MKKILLLFALLAACSFAFAQTAVVNSCEWFTGADPGVGLGNSLVIGTPEAQELLNFSVATGSFGAGSLQRVKIRCRADSLRSGALDVWSVATDGFIALSPTGTARLITSMSYQWNNGAFTNVDVTDAANAPLNEIVATTGLPDGMNRLRVRATDDLGRTGVVVDGFCVISNTTGFASRLVTQMEYRFDGGAFTPVDVADQGIVNLNQIVATTGLTDGLHRLQVRSTDDLGRVGQVHDGYLVISNTAGYSPRLVTQMEYRIDGGSFVNFDYPDNGLINFNEVIPTGSLAIGLHTVDMRSIDDLGRTGQVHRAYLIVSSPFVGGQVRTIVAAELFAGNDPGVGNGIPIPLPQDGSWDEGTEDVQYVYTGFPVGEYRVGFRTQDDLGRWSQVEFDSLLVGPILVVNRSGDDIVLNWRLAADIDMYYIERATTVNGSYAVIDSTTATTYSDLGAVPASNTYFYQVRFRDDIIHLEEPDRTPDRR